MRRTKVLDEQRDEIVRLRQKGTKWTDIQKTLKIDRRIAKSAYEKWMYSLSEEKLREVRKEIATEEFRNHIEAIVQVATALASNIDQLPRLINEMTKNGEEFLTWLLEQDILKRYSPSETYNYRKPEDTLNFRSKDNRIYYEEKKMLYDSLRVHTKEKVPWETTFDDVWKNARNKCAECVPKIINEIGKFVDNYYKEIEFAKNVRAATNDKDPASLMKRAITKAIWLPLVSNDLIDRDKITEGTFSSVLNKKTTSVDVTLKFGVETFERVYILNGNNKEILARKLSEQCNSAVKIISEKIFIQDLKEGVNNIKKASDELRGMLNPLKLKPTILNTRCDLCPV